MKFWQFVFVLVLGLQAGSAAADERLQNKNNDIQLKQRSKPELKSQLRRPRTFDEYIADLKSAARKDKPQPANPVIEEESKQIAANRYKNYKPLNPVIIEW